MLNYNYFEYIFIFLSKDNFCTNQFLNNLSYSTMIVDR